MVPKEHRAPYLETPLLAVNLQDSPWRGQIWPAFPGEHYHMPAGGCRGIYSQSHGRCQPLHNSCKKGDSYAQGYSVSLSHLGRTSEVLNSSLQENLLVVGCVEFLFIFQYREKELKWKEVLHLIWDLFLFIHFNPMISHPFFHPAQVSWSDVLVLFSFIFLPGPGEPCDDF